MRIHNISSRSPDTPPRSVAVLGAGTMGAGMALSFALAGSDVQLWSRSSPTIDRARSRIEDGLALPGGTEGRSIDESHSVTGRIQMTTSLSDIDLSAELLIETISEDLEAKREVYALVEGRLADHTIVTTNTSSLPLTTLEALVPQPERFAGYHWFNPPELIRLVEIVHAPRTTEETVERLQGWSIAVGKTPVVIRRAVDGFVANRLQYALIREAYALVAEGVCTIADVDRVVTAGLGPRWAAIGPFEAMDLAGLDVHRQVAGRLFPSLSNDRQPPALLDRLVKDGALGCKSGRGLYGAYGPDDVQRLIDRRTSVLLALAERTASIDPQTT